MLAATTPVHLRSCFYSPSVYTNLLSKISTHRSLSKKKEYNAVQIAKLTKKFWTKETLKPDTSEMKGKKKIMLSSFLKPFKEPPVNRRIAGLNTIFMEKITDLLSTSDIPSKVAGCGLEITRTHVQNRLTAIHVYWVSSDPANDQKIHETLVNAAGGIRAQLYAQQVLGKIPPIIFLRDSAHNNVFQVESLLRKADYGDDFEPRRLAEQPVPKQAVPVINKEISKEIMESVELKLNEIEQEELSSEHPVPAFSSPLRQNIFGVDRERIMNQVKLGRKNTKTKDREKDFNFAPPTSDIAPPTTAVTPPTPQFAPPTSHARTNEIRKWVKSYKKLRLMSGKKLRQEDDALNAQAIQDGEEEEEEVEEYYFEEEEEELDDGRSYKDEDRRY